VIQSGHPQVGNRDGVANIAKASGRNLRLLQQAVHGFNIGVAAPIKHAIPTALS